MFHCFLKRPPEYNLPTSPKGPSSDVDGLKPTLSSVVLHRHGDELAVTVEGSNLWFSYQISLHDTEKISIPGDKSIGTSIQYTLNGDQEDKIAVEREVVKVSLHNRFSSKPSKEHVPVHKKVIKAYIIVILHKFIYTISADKFTVVCLYCTPLAELFSVYQAAATSCPDFITAD